MWERIPPVSVTRAPTLGKSTDPDRQGDRADEHAAGLELAELGLTHDYPHGARVAARRGERAAHDCASHLRSLALLGGFGMLRVVAGELSPPLPSALHEVVNPSPSNRSCYGAGWSSI